MNQPVEYYWKKCACKTCVFYQNRTNLCNRGDIDCKGWIPIKDIPAPIIHRKVVNAILELNTVDV